MCFPVSVSSAKPHDFSPSVEVAACYLEFNDKFLFLKRAIGEREENTWVIPGGKIEEGETAHQAAKRETFEEVGIKLDGSKLHDVEKMFVRKPGIDYVFHMFHYDLSQLPPVSLSDEHQAFRWVTLQEALKMPLISGAVEVIHHFQTFKKQPNEEMTYG